LERTAMSNGQMQQPPAAPAGPVANFPKQAIVVIHGMGEQMPMDTIKGFVRAAWETVTDLATKDLPKPTEVWSKPDVRTGSLELRRITTRQTISTATFGIGVRSDFYELYWADLSGGSTWNQVKDWVGGLLLRNPFTRVPRDVLLAWVVLWLITLAVVVLSVAAALPETASIGSIHLWEYWPLKCLRDWKGWQLTIVIAALGWVATSFIVPYFGRVVRYTRAKPDNIAARKNIRERGLALLSELHDKEYARIIIVGHSLGSILAYDLLSYFWARHQAARVVVEGTAEFDALRKIETALADPAWPAEPAVAAYRAAQSEFAALLRRRPKPADTAADTRWLITDFVTLGSPLSHAEFLIAASKQDLKKRQDDREYPTAPPLRELLDPNYVPRAQRAGFPLDAREPKLLAFPFGADQWQLHHATPFAAVRWTNIHDPAFLVAFGDLISGPVAPVFGPAVVDVDLKKLRGRQSLCFTHTKYWSLPKRATAKVPVHIEELRKALDLGGQLRPL
jgi:pimeloyl-ACP methyl ester carboxylesterase